MVDKQTQMFPCEYCEAFTNTCFKEHLQITAFIRFALKSNIFVQFLIFHCFMFHLILVILFMYFEETSPNDDKVSQSIYITIM